MAYLSDGQRRTSTTIWAALFHGPFPELNPNIRKPLRRLVERGWLCNEWTPNHEGGALEFTYWLKCGGDMTQITHTTYRLDCDRCEASEPTGPVTIAKGWGRVVVMLYDLDRERIEVDLCPDHMSVFKAAAGLK